MKRLFCCFIIAFLISIFSFACDSSKKSPTSDDTTPLTKEEWLQENAVSFTSLDASNEDFSDLETLKTIIGDAKIVMLGEQSHGDGTTFEAKVRLVKFLHQEMGFDVISFESGLYDCYKAWQLMQQGTPALEAAQEAIFSLWTECREVEPLFTYMNTTLGSGQELELAGFDSQFTGDISAEFFVQDLNEFLEDAGIDTTGREFWQESKAILQKLTERGYNYDDIPDASTQNSFFAALSQIKNELDKPSTRADSRETAFWIQLLTSIAVHAEMTWNIIWDNFCLTPKEVFNLRDDQMGYNLVWLSNSYYPNRKIIAWAASRHVARNITSIKVEGDPDFYDGYSTMGRVVWESVGALSYTLCFTAYDGSAGSIYDPPWSIGAASVGSMEYFMSSAGLENAIIDFRNISAGGEWLKEDLSCRAFGYAPATADWTDVMDGIMFTRVMEPATPIGAGKLNAYNTLFEYSVEQRFH